MKAFALVFVGLAFAVLLGEFILTTPEPNVMELSPAYAEIESWEQIQTPRHAIVYGTFLN